MYLKVKKETEEADLLLYAAKEKTVTNELRGSPFIYLTTSFVYEGEKDYLCQLGNMASIVNDLGQYQNSLQFLTKPKYDKLINSGKYKPL